MRVTIADRKKFVSGMLFAGVGALALILSTEYRIGSAVRMGPGYYPLCLSIVLVGLGLLSIVSALGHEPGPPIGHWSLVPLAFVTVSIVTFAVLIDRLGLVFSVVVLVGLSCFERWRTRRLEILAIALVLSAATTALFIYALGLPFAVFPRS